jgi:uncharacterized damage-inducible protein DinB
MSTWSNIYRHHRWSNRVLIDFLAGLTDEQLELSVPGTYGGSLATIRHVVSADADYLRIIPGAPGVRQISDDGDWGGWDELRSIAWEAGSALVDHADGLTDDAFFIDDGGGEPRELTLSVLLGQVIHHATDHRTQIQTTLSAHGIEPPDLSVWSWGRSEEGRSVLERLRPQP